MIFLIGGVLASTFIFVIFRLFPRFGVDTFQAIVFNYLTAFCCGFLLYGSEFSPKALEHVEWLPFAVLAGLLFISLFLVMGISSQRNGVALTSVSVKMSMALSMLFMIVSYDEPLSAMKLAGMVFAFAGVLLMSLPSGKAANTGSRPVAWMLFVLFTGSAVLDFVLNYVQNYKLEYLPSSLFSAIGFGFAGIFGLTLLAIELLRGKRKFHVRNVFAGVLLGIPNYFSIFLLMLSYSTTGWNDSSVLAITNVAIVLLAALIGFAGFRETFGWKKLAGLAACVLAITLLYFSSLPASHE